MMAASGATGLSLEALMFEFGRYWMPWALSQAGYDKVHSCLHAGNSRCSERDHGVLNNDAGAVGC